VVDELVRFGQVQPVWLGMVVGDAREEDPAPGGRPDAGLPVLRIAGGGAAERAGLAVGDLVLSVDGKVVRSAGELHYEAGRHGAGEPVRLGVRRGEERREVSVPAEPFAAGAVERIAWDWLGLAVAQDRAMVRISRVRRGGPAARIGLAPGDLVLQVAGEEVGSLESFGHGILLATQRGKFPLLVQRGRRGYYVTLPVADQGESDL